MAEKQCNQPLVYGLTARQVGEMTMAIKNADACMRVAAWVSRTQHVFDDMQYMRDSDSVQRAGIVSCIPKKSELDAEAVSQMLYGACHQLYGVYEAIEDAPRIKPAELVDSIAAKGVSHG